MQLCLKQKAFAELFPHFWNVYQISNIFLKKMILKDYVFPKLATAKHTIVSEGTFS